MTCAWSGLKAAEKINCKEYPKPLAQILRAELYMLESDSLGDKCSLDGMQRESKFRCTYHHIRSNYVFCQFQKWKCVNTTNSEDLNEFDFYVLGGSTYALLLLP